MDLGLPETQAALVGGRRMSWCAAGDGGLPLVLLHGIGSNAASWVEQLATLSRTRRVVAWNAPGYGDSAPLDSARPGPDDYADALAGLLDHLGFHQVDLVGHSLGGLIAARFCVRAPQRVRRLVLSSPAAGYAVDPAADLPPALARRIADVETLGPGGMADKRAARTLSDTAAPLALARARHAMASVTVGGYAQATWMLAQGNILADAAALRLPALVLCGTVDVVTPIDGVRRIAAALPGAAFQPIEGAGHASYADRPEVYRETIAPFLA